MLSEGAHCMREGAMTARLMRGFNQMRCIHVPGQHCCMIRSPTKAACHTLTASSLLSDTLLA